MFTNFETKLKQKNVHRITLAQQGNYRPPELGIRGTDVERFRHIRDFFVRGLDL